MYEIKKTPGIDSIFKKLARKDRSQLEAVDKKLAQIVENPHKFKPLRNIMKGLWRVHIGSFVLVYSIDETNKVVKLIDYAHHDNIYRK